MNKENIKESLIEIYQALLAINVKGADVITLSNVLNYVSGLIRETDTPNENIEPDKN